MALINVGTFDEFSVNTKPEALIKHNFLGHIKSISALTEIGKNFSENTFEYATSKEPRGIDLKSVELTKGFEGFLGNLFKETNEVYFLAWAWDLSGQPVNQYPETGVAPEDVLFKLKAGNVREFMGAGIKLFPKRKVIGGINLRIQIWESDKDKRDFGEMLKQTTETIKNSKLNSLLTVASLATGITGATFALIKKASIELGGLIGTILKNNSDDYVDLFAGHYPADAIWNTNKETYSGNSSKIEINKY